MNEVQDVSLDGAEESILISGSVDLAVFGEGLILHHVTPYLEALGVERAMVGRPFLDLVDGAESRALLAAFCASHQLSRSTTAKSSDGVVFSVLSAENRNVHAAFVDVPLSKPAMLVRVFAPAASSDAALAFIVRKPCDHSTTQQFANDDTRTSNGPATGHRILSLAHAYWENDMATGKFLVSNAWLDMRGLEAQDNEEQKFASWDERIHPEDRPSLSLYLRKLRQGQADWVSIIYRERHEHGHWITILCRGAVVDWDENGLPTRTAGTDTDITASHSTEEYARQLAQLEQRWLIAAEYGQLGLWDNDETAGTRYVSHTWRTMRGYSPDDIFDESRAAQVERTHPDDRAAFAGQIAATTGGEVDIVLQEFRERHRDGHWISILSRGRVIGRDAQGRAQRIIGIDTDITEVKAASERVHRMSRRLELAIATTQVGVWDHDFTRGETVWDARMVEIFGLDQPPGLVPPMTWENAIHPDDRQRVLTDTNNLSAGEVAFSDQYKIVRPDGCIRHVRSRTTKIFNDEGGHGLIGVTWDVTADIEAADELRRAHALASQRNEQLERARKEMEHNALHDSLTGLPNRRYLDKRMKGPTKPGVEMAVLHIDLDRFKQINDTLGHSAGDAVLRHVSSILDRLTPPTATLARVGGDEFVILFDSAPARKILTRIASRIVSELRVPFKISKQECRLGASVGIATGTPAEASAEEVFENADMALYEAKSRGRSRFLYFADRMRVAAEAKRLLADAILGGIDRDEFYCVYQPQFEAASLKLSGVEALVRWRKPDGTIVMPSEFLCVAEELAVVDRIDHKVLNQVLADQAAWRDLDLTVPRVSVNISSRRLADPRLPRLLERLKIGEGQIAFELLETVFLDSPDRVIAANIAAIRKLGIEIEIDDFGTGHASIVGMLRLQPNRLKIDRQLIGPMMSGEKELQLVKSIIEIGRMHGIELIAEGQDS